MKRSASQERIFEQAEAWFVHLESGEATAADRQRFEAWVAQSAEHREVCARIADLCDGISGLRHLAMGANVVRFPSAGSPESGRAGSWRRTGSKAAAALLLCVGLVWGAFQFIALPQATYVTQISQLKTVGLADGSVVTLGAKSGMSVRYTDNERHVRLKNGEAFFSVRPDAGRPFFVEAGGAVVRVVGTQFSVHTSSDRITVAVADGAVDVLKGRPGLLGGAVERLRLLAGQKLIVARGDGELREVKPVRRDEAASWRSGQLVYDDVPLKEVIADANRYYAKPIVLGSKDISDLRLTAAYPSQQIDRMLEGLPDLLPVRIEHGTDGTVTIISDVTSAHAQTSSR